MTTASFQSALARLVFDRTFRQSVSARGHAGLSPSLSPLERERLCAVAKSRGLDIVRRMYVSFRLARLSAGAPYTLRLLTCAGHARALERYLSCCPPTSFYYVDEGTALVEHLSRRLRRQSLRLAYLREVLDYDRAILKLHASRVRNVDTRVLLRPRYDLSTLLVALDRHERPRRIPRSRGALSLCLVDGVPRIEPVDQSSLGGQVPRAQL